LGYEAALGCWRPGRSWLQTRLIGHVLGKHRPPYACRGALAYCLAAPEADHYFLINDRSSAVRAQLTLRDYRYVGWEDAVTRRPLPRGRAITIPPHGARWIRCRK
jgi:beta-galactosidase